MSGVTQLNIISNARIEREMGELSKKVQEIGLKWYDVDVVGQQYYVDNSYIVLTTLTYNWLLRQNLIS